MINWNIVPMLWGSPEYPYILFTEMEWIGKLSYMVTDLDSRVTENTNTLTDHETRIGNIETVEIPAIKVRLGNVETVVADNVSRLNTIQNTTIPAIQQEITEVSNELYARSPVLLSYPILPTPTDTATQRSYTIQLNSDYTLAELSFKLTADYASMSGHNYEQDITINIPTRNAETKYNTFIYALPGEYGTDAFEFNTITFSTDNNYNLTITYMKDRAIAVVNATAIDMEDFPTITRPIIKYINPAT